MLICPIQSQITRNFNMSNSNIPVRCNLEQNLSPCKITQIWSTTILIPRFVVFTHLPEKLSPVRNSRNTDSPYHCPRYDNKLAARNNVKERFPHCITKDGNPDALRWNGHTSLKPLCKGEMRDKARCDRFRDSLEAWSGVAIPSKLSWGQVIVKFVSSVRVSSARRGNHLCAVCDGGPFSKIDHVKSHFIGCVKRYGNPTGANWYDRLDPKHIKKHLPGRPDATVYAPPTM